MAGHLKRNLAIGLLGGLAGVAAMDGYWKGLGRAKPEWTHTDEEPSTHKLVRKTLGKAGVRSPSSSIRKRGGKAVHWGYGAMWGMIAGASRAGGVPLTWGGGLPLGAGLWALSDEYMLSKLDLAKPPREYPPRTHAASLGAHLAYGLGLWAAMKMLGGGGEERRRFLRRVA
ncbi:MAG: hypothetical protein ACRD1C_04165 [Terriglobales bacterium]